MGSQRKVVLVTSLGKKYYGNVDVPNETLRTTDLFNSNAIYWKDPSEKCFENAILLHDVQLVIDDSPVRVQFDRIQVRLKEIVYFHDDVPEITDEKEKMRASTMVQKTQEQVQTVTIITTRVANSFYNLSGTFFGLFKKKQSAYALQRPHITPARRGGLPPEPGHRRMSSQSAHMLYGRQGP